jgi:hypothetical protein
MKDTSSKEVLMDFGKAAMKKVGKYYVTELG